MTKTVVMYTIYDIQVLDSSFQFSQTYISQGRTFNMRVSGMFFNSPCFWTDRRTNRKFSRQFSSLSVGCIENVRFSCHFFFKSLPTLEKGGGSQVLGPWEQEKSLSIECGGSSYLGTFNRNCNLGNDWERSAASALRCIRVEGHG